MNQSLRNIIFAVVSIFAINICLAKEKQTFPTSYSELHYDEHGSQKWKYGFVDKDGNKICDAIYDKVTPFSSNGIALVYRNGYYGFIYPNGEYLMGTGIKDARPFDEFGLAAIRIKSKWGLIDSEGYWVLKEIFDKIEPFQSNGLAIVKYQGKFGLVDTLGNVVLPVVYDKVENFDKNGYAYIKSNNLTGVVDKRGRALVQPEYKDKKKAMTAALSLKPKFGKDSDVSLADMAAVVKKHSAPAPSLESEPDKTNKEEEQRLLAEQEKARKAEEEQRLLAEQEKARKAEEEQRLLAEQEKARKAEEEQRLLAEQEKARKAEEEQRLLAEQEKARKAEEEQRLLAEQEKARKAEEEQRLLAEQEEARKAEENRRAETRKRLEETPSLKNYIAANLGEWQTYLASKNLNLPSDEEIRDYIEKQVGEWQIKGEFEPTAKWKERVNEETRTAKINSIADSIMTANSKVVDAVRAEYKKEYENLADGYCNTIAEHFASQTLQLKPYDADNETFLISTDDYGDFLLPVPLDEAPTFKNEWDNWKNKATAIFVPNGDDVALKSVSIGKYTFDSSMNASYAQVDVDYNFRPVDVSQLNRSLIDGGSEGMIAQNNEGSRTNRGFQTEIVKVSAGNAADTDINIPEGSSGETPTFAVIIANGNYAHASKVKHAENDGLIMEKYLTRTLGIPQGNVATFLDATYGEMASAISLLQDIGDAYKGSDFNILFYYVGHGLPDDEGRKSYIIPVDVDPRHVSICMPLEKIYADLGNLGAKNVTVMVDACFSGANHGEGMLIPQAMSVALKPKKSSPVGNMVVLAATEGSETAFPYEEKSHGLFTYWLLKKLQETSGKVSLGELSDYVISNVKKTAVTVNRKPQTPTVSISPKLINNWRSLPFGK